MAIDCDKLKRVDKRCDCSRLGEVGEETGRQQDVDGMESDVSGSGVSNMQDLELLLRNVASKKRIMYMTTRPNDIKMPFEMWEQAYREDEKQRTISCSFTLEWRKMSVKLAGLYTLNVVEVTRYASAIFLLNFLILVITVEGYTVPHTASELKADASDSFLLNHRKPRRAMNASEYVSKGYALECTIPNPTFKVTDFQWWLRSCEKKFNLIEIFSYGQDLSLLVARTWAIADMMFNLVKSDGVRQDRCGWCWIYEGAVGELSFEGSMQGDGGLGIGLGFLKSLDREFLGDDIGDDTMNVMRVMKMRTNLE
nr:ATP-dependent zinc metalloprotease FTSH 9, chloroplastic-like [Tanacetum cinerariifolium]